MKDSKKEGRKEYCREDGCVGQSEGKWKERLRGLCTRQKEEAGATVRGSVVSQGGYRGEWQSCWYVQLDTCVGKRSKTVQ
jgi:hypothetical protein